MVADSPFLSQHPGFAEGVPQAGAFVMQADERLKTPRTAGLIWREMQRCRIERGGPVLAAGGGLVLDVAGFAAATWARGVRLVSVPTTLLAQVDACLGGKTGVNLGRAKNQVGAFHPAEEIVICPAFLDTLPEREVRCGAGEVLKTAILSGDPALRELTGAIPPPGPARRSWFRTASERCLAFKAAVVREDPFERGRRIIRNLGHTGGHALEGATGFALSHGEAVGLGLVAAAVVARRFGAPGTLAGEIRSALAGMGLPVTVPPGADPAPLLARDKKTRGGSRTWVLPLGWGRVTTAVIEPADEAVLLAGAMSELRG